MCREVAAAGCICPPFVSAFGASGVVFVFMVLFLCGRRLDSLHSQIPALVGALRGLAVTSRLVLHLSLFAVGLGALAGRLVLHLRDVEPRVQLLQAHALVQRQLGVAQLPILLQASGLALMAQVILFRPHLDLGLLDHDLRWW